MQKSAAKAQALRLLWFEFLTDNPVGFEMKKRVDGKIADFYSDAADLAIFIDSRHRDRSAVPGELYFSSDEILNQMSRVCAKINCCVKLGLLPGRHGANGGMENA